LLVISTDDKSKFRNGFIQEEKKKKTPSQSSSTTFTLLSCKPHTQQGTADLNIATRHIYVYVNKAEIQFSFGIRGQRLNSCIYIPFDNGIGILLQLLNTFLWKVYFQHVSQTAWTKDSYKQHMPHPEQQAPSHRSSDGKISSVFVSSLHRNREQVPQKVTKPFWHYRN